MKSKKISLLDIGKIYLRTMKLLYKVDKFLLASLLILSILLGLLPGITMILMQGLINGLQSVNIQVKEVFIYLIAYLAIDFICSILRNFYGYYSNKLSLLMGMEIDLKILSKTKVLKLSHFENSESYNIIQRASMAGGSQLYEYFLKILVIIQNVSNFIIAMMILLKWNYWASCIIILITIANTAFKLKLSKKQYDIIVKRTEKARESGYYNFLLTNDIAFKEIKLFQLHSYFINKFKIIKKDFFSQDINLRKEHRKLDNIFTAIEQSADFAILSSIVIDASKKKILVGDTVTYVRAISNIKSNVNQILSEIVAIYNQSLFISQLFNFLDIAPDTDDEGNIKINFINDIEAKNLSYCYKNNKKYTLKNINFRWKKGDNIILVGKNGSGKTTLLKIILGYYDDYEGELFLNGINLKNIEKDSLRKNISVVLQDFNKYELSLRENVGLSNLKKMQDKEYIEEVMKNVYMKENFLSNLNMQLGYWFKNGVQLSGGEWMKVAIARAFARKADLYIWDEPNASLDTIAEQEIWKSIQRITNDKISILITHRIENIRQLQGNIIVIKDGEIIDTGNHLELINRCNEYMNLYKASNTEII